MLYDVGLQNKATSPDHPSGDSLFPIRTSAMDPTHVAPRPPGIGNSRYCHYMPGMRHAYHYTARTVKNVAALRPAGAATSFVGIALVLNGLVKRR